MNLDAYRTFVTLAKTLSFSNTASQLNVVQSTVSARVAELEKYLSQILFIRSKRSVELTHAGRIFLPYAEKILNTEEEGLKKLKTMGLYEDQLKICIFGSLYREKLSAVIDEYYKKYPMYELDIEFRITEVQLEMLLENEIDIGFISWTPNSRKLEIRPYIEYDVILVAHRDYPIDNSITTETLSTVDLAITSHNKVLQEWIDTAMPNNYRPRLRINSSVQLVEYVRKGYGCAFVLDFLVQSELDSGILRKIDIEGISPLRLPSYVAINKNRMKAAAVQRFLELIPEIDKC